MRRHTLLSLLSLLLVVGVRAVAVAEPVIDPEAATEAYLASVPAEDRERSDAYFEGGYWLKLVDYLYGLAVAWLILRTRLSARMRDAAERWRGRGFVGSSGPDGASVSASPTSATSPASRFWPRFSRPISFS